MRPQASDTKYDQIDGDDIIQQSRNGQDQNARDQCDHGLQQGDIEVNVHRAWLHFWCWYDAGAPQFVRTIVSWAMPVRTLDRRRLLYQRSESPFRSTTLNTAIIAPG